MCSPTQLRPGEPPKLWQELAYTFDSKGLWSAHIEQTVKEARQRLGAINRVKQYLRDTLSLIHMLSSTNSYGEKSMAVR